MWRNSRVFGRDPKGRGFKSQLVHLQVTALSKLLTRTCLCHQAVQSGTGPMGGKVSARLAESNGSLLALSPAISKPTFSLILNWRHKRLCIPRRTRWRYTNVVLLLLWLTARTPALALSPMLDNRYGRT